MLCDERQAVWPDEYFSQNSLVVDPSHWLVDFFSVHASSSPLLVADWLTLLWPVSQEECHLELSLRLLLLYAHIFMCCWLEELAGCLYPQCRQEWLLDAIFLQVGGT